MQLLQSYLKKAFLSVKWGKIIEYKCKNVLEKSGSTSNFFFIKP
jgi:hypothetical protein